MASYYEMQISSMNVRRIREMPRKEVFKITNPNEDAMLFSDSSVSPLKAMMITKPADDSCRSKKQTRDYSNKRVQSSMGCGSYTNRVSLKSSNRCSLAERDKPTSLTPKISKARGMNQ